MGQDTPWGQRSYFHANLHPRSPLGLSVVGLSVETLSQIPAAPSLCGLTVLFVDITRV